eukprot:2952998-Prymnesium_polylepis.1
MMAVRAGAKRVSSLDMVPAMAAVATHIVAQNGMADVVRVQNIKSTDLEPEDLGGRAEMLVCELVDNEFLGEGTLYSIADARRRLLAPNAPIVPKGGAIYAIPAQVGAPDHCGFKLDELNLFVADAPFRTGNYSNDGRKVQLDGPAHYKPLGPPLLLFDFDWESCPIDEICSERIAELTLTATASGELNAFIVYFTLACDGEPGNTLSTGPDDEPNPAGGPPTHWDQSFRYLPVALRVAPGDRLRVVARHTDTLVQLGLRDVPPSACVTVGHRDVATLSARANVAAATTGTAVLLESSTPIINLTGTAGGPPSDGEFERIETAQLVGSVVAQPLLELITTFASVGQFVPDAFMLMACGGWPMQQLPDAQAHHVYAQPHPVRGAAPHLHGRRGPLRAQEDQPLRLDADATLLLGQNVRRRYSHPARGAAPAPRQDHALHARGVGRHVWAPVLGRAARQPLVGAARASRRRAAQARARPRQGHECCRADIRGGARAQPAVRARRLGEPVRLLCAGDDAPLGGAHAGERQGARRVPAAASTRARWRRSGRGARRLGPARVAPQP